MNSVMPRKDHGAESDTPAANRLLTNVLSGTIDRLYSLGNFATPRHVEFACASGMFHSLWFDLEHFDIPVEALAEMNAVARAYPMTSLARLKVADEDAIGRVLATGVGAVMAAMVESAEEAAAIVRWVKGGAKVGPAVPLRAEVAVICQIETREAVQQLEAIAAVRGVDGLFFGPGDYAHRIGYVGQISHPEVTAAMDLVAEASRRHGKFWGTVSAGREHFEKVCARGARLVGVGGDVRVMHFGLRELVKTFEGMPAGF